MVDYLSAIGVTATSDTVNRWLVILAVLLVECGGGLALAVGMSLSGTEAENEHREARSAVDVSSAEAHQGRAARSGAASNTAPATPPHNSHGVAGVGAPLLPAAEMPMVPHVLAGVAGVLPDAVPARTRTLRLLVDNNGHLRTSHAALGQVLGVSAARAGRLLRELAAAGAIRVRASSTGTVVTLIEHAAGVH